MVSLYFHTLRHLHIEQITNRIQRRLWHPKVSVGPTPPLMSRIPFQGLKKKSSFTPPNRFCFLNVTHEVVSPNDWNNPDRDPLWLFNLHYFDNLSSFSNEEHHALWIAKWIEENPIGSGFGWEPYTISLRSVNWIKWHWRTGGLNANALASLAHQARHLKATLEYHLGGNHLWANAKALIFLGSFFSGEEATSWLKLGLDLMQKQIAVQILSDGAHYERSTLYQAILTEDILELVELAQKSSLKHQLTLWKQTSTKMLRWLKGMSHGDGEISFFNDAAIGIAQSPTRLLEYAKALQILHEDVPEGLTLFKESGYIRASFGNKLMLIDVGPLGPDELLGHAHADSLSFEYSVGPQRVIVNSGTSTYWNSALRNLQRGTRCHNTVEIDGENSSEVWSRFRVARRAYTTLIECTEKSGQIVVEASHDGYKRLKGSPIHNRRWVLDSRGFEVSDAISNKNPALAFFHFHPSVQHKPDRLNWSGGHMKWQTPNTNRILNSQYYPEFGVEISNQTLEVQIEKLRAQFSLRDD